MACLLGYSVAFGVLMLLFNFSSGWAVKVTRPLQLQTQRVSETGRWYEGSNMRGKGRVLAPVRGPMQEMEGHETLKWEQRQRRQRGRRSAQERRRRQSTPVAAYGCSPCEEVYVVRDEGETLQTISEKCHAPFILLDNPHVQDTDDISAGSVLLISSTHLPCSHL
ncbi:hypothetical protein KP509_02G111400 [Ceratopteris richardii]|uniref:LysM domain-containing protein n=1 Tax=Ceratopteris richardii TaxID=49495 RepID=A0A8T2VCV5_CERRI|nr:hypothetical protein KP509_02G111400 [Ceratopteris richardii]